MISESVTLAAGTGQIGDLPSSLQSGVTRFFSEASVFSTVLQIVGGLVVAICLVLLVLSWFRPNSQIVQKYVGGKKISFVIAGLVLGGLFIAPKETFGAIAYGLGWITQGLVNLFLKILK